MNSLSGAVSMSVIRRFLIRYGERHQTWANIILQTIGLPLTFLVPIIWAIYYPWEWAVAAFFTGYLFQFLGHLLEGNDAAEVILIKKCLGLPYIEVVHRSDQSKQSRFDD